MVNVFGDTSKFVFCCLATKRNHTLELQSAADIVSLLFKVTNGRKIIKLKHLQKLLFELTFLLMGDIHYRMILWERKILTQIHKV